ncbi:MAG: ferrous iron transport protein A [Halobacteriovoraceae bacterium]|jgi:Fe2+ transport system protein FeoA|nr:ferrous iron transport protein A [Halobacteriovoraceae bacterium]
MLLDDAQIKQDYQVVGVNYPDEKVLARLYQLGIVPGEMIKLIRKAPIFKDPLLFEISGVQVAITTSMAKNITIELKQ